MNTLSEIHPGKLKRKAKKSPNTSVVDMPAAGGQAPMGNLLGDMLMEPEAVPSPEPPEPQPTPSVSLPEAVDVRETRVEPEASLLDQLHVESDAADASEPRGQFLPLRLQRKAQKEQTAESQMPSHADISRLNEILVETRELQQKCTDTLVKLQNANIQNERRYAVYLTIAFVLLAIVSVVGVIIGTNLKNNARVSDLKYKHETYVAAVNANKTCNAEFDREKKGSEAAYEVYQKISLGLFEEAIDKYVENRDLILHPAEAALLQDKINEIRGILAENAYHEGRKLYNENSYDQARDAFFKSLSYKEDTPFIDRLHFYYAMSLYYLGDFEGGRRYFAMLGTAELPADLDAQMRYHYGICAEKVGNFQEAYDQFDQFLRRYRNHKLADDASKHRSKVESGRKN